jgi:hypothetical protein
VTSGAEHAQEELLVRIRAWRRHNIRIGLAPWSPAAWEGLLEREPYGGTAGYARVFSTGLIRLGNAPLARQTLLEELPDDFGWSVECAHEAMVYRFPHRHADRNKRGERNDGFLDPEQVAGFAATVQRALGARLQAIILRIAPIYPTEGIRSPEFLALLKRCLASLPASGRYAVQSGNPEYVTPALLDELAERNISFLAPAAGLADLVQSPGMMAARTIVACSDALCDGGAEGERALHALVRRCLDEEREALVYLYDQGDRPGPGVGRGEGPGRLARLLAGLDCELARRSPIKRAAA